MKIELSVGFTYMGKEVKSCEIKRRPVVADRVQAVLFSKSKFGEELEDAIACYLISKLCTFEGKEIPAEFLLENMDYEDMIAVWEKLVKFRSSPQIHQKSDQNPSGNGLQLEGDKTTERGGAN